MDDVWKKEAFLLSDELLKPCYKILCEQSNCCDRGFDPSDCGNCAWCADSVDSVIGTYLHLVKTQKP